MSPSRVAGYLLYRAVGIGERFVGPRPTPMPHISEPPRSAIERVYDAHVNSARVRMGHRYCAEAVRVVERAASDARCAGLESLALTLYAAADRLDEKLAQELLELSRTSLP